VLEINIPGFGLVVLKELAADFTGTLKPDNRRLES
jgi:hypothetical protein